MKITFNPDPLRAEVHGVIRFEPQSDDEEDFDTIVQLNEITENSDYDVGPIYFRLPKVCEYDEDRKYWTFTFRPEHPGVYEAVWITNCDGLEEFPAAMNAVSETAEAELFERIRNVEGREERGPDGHVHFRVLARGPQQIQLVSNESADSFHDALWNFIETISGRLRFDNFTDFANSALDVGKGAPDNGTCPSPGWYGTDPYERLDRASIDFVAAAANPSWIQNHNGDDHRTDPDHLAGLETSYVHGISAHSTAAPFLDNYQPRHWKFPLPAVPMVELIWNYWMEEGMLVQTMNRILARFQNRIADSGRDPLARCSVSPLLPVRSLLWGFAESERRRLSVRRRASEYEYQYGLHLVGRAIPPRAIAVERRSQFLEAFHSLLNSTYLFYKEYDDKTVSADAFPLLSSLRELHLILAYGANNQFADLPLTARREMIVMQCILAQPEFREFLGGRAMVPYEEAWMDRVDTMKSMQTWSDVSISQFFDLAVHGEKLLLSVRHGQWNDSDIGRDDAENWAIHFRNSVQRYIHAYRAVTGVDLMTGVDSTMPSARIAQRLHQQYAQRA